MHRTSTTQLWLFFPRADQEEYVEDSRAGETCQDWQPRAQELCLWTEQVCGQAAGAKPPLHLLSASQLPALAGSPLGGEGEQLWENLLSQGRFLLPKKTGWLALKTASIWQLQIAVSMSTHFIHIPHWGIRKPRTHWWFPGFMDLYSPPPRPATHFWFLCSQCPGICSVGNLNWEPIAPQLLSIKMCNWVSQACFKHRSRRDLQATV